MTPAKEDTYRNRVLAARPADEVNRFQPLPANDVAKIILSVDDEQLVLSLRQNVLESAGYTVLSAFDGEQALELLREGHIDLALLDQNMPGMDGVTVARE